MFNTMLFNDLGLCFLLAALLSNEVAQKVRRRSGEKLASMVYGHGLEAYCLTSESSTYTLTSDRWGGHGLLNKCRAGFLVTLGCGPTCS
jgi:hypothetical protein